MSEKSKEEKLTQEIIQLSYELLNVETKDGKPIFIHELYFSMPSIKKALSLYAAINRELEAKALIATVILLRSLIEVICMYVYVGGIKKDSKFYEKFSKTGRLSVLKDGKWQKISIGEQIRFVEKVFPITDLQKAYNHCSDLVHYSSETMKLIIHNTDDTTHQAGIVVGADEKHIAKKNFDDCEETAYKMMLTLKMCLQAELHSKKKLQSNS